MLIEMIGDDEMEGKVSTNQDSTIGFILECQESHIAIRHNGFEMSGPSSTSIIHQVLDELGRISGPLH